MCRQDSVIMEDSPARAALGSGKADFQDEVTDPDMRDAAASPVHNPGQQDDGKDDHNKPYTRPAA
jgi:hypothetical protein